MGKGGYKEAILKKDDCICFIDDMGKKFILQMKWVTMKGGKEGGRVIKRAKKGEITHLKLNRVIIKGKKGGKS